MQEKSSVTRRALPFAPACASSRNGSEAKGATGPERLAFNRVTTLAKVLNERREAIARRWIERVRGHLSSGRALDEEEVLDSLHAFLDEVVAALEAGTPLDRKSTRLHSSHT